MSLFKITEGMFFVYGLFTSIAGNLLQNIIFFIEKVSFLFRRPEVLFHLHRKAELLFLLHIIALPFFLILSESLLIFLP